MLRLSQNYLKGLELNCVMLSTVSFRGMPKWQIMFFQKNFWTFFDVITVRGSASTHLEKYSNVTTAY